MIGLLAGSLNSVKVEAKQVEMKKQLNQKVKVAFLNDEIDKDVKEIVFKIKNNTETKIKVKNIEIQVQENSGWIPFEKREDVKTGCSIKISGKNTIYGSVVLWENYRIPQSGLPAGKYSLYVKYRCQGKSYFARKTFIIEKEDTESDNNQQYVTNSAMPAAVPKGTTATTVCGATITGDSNALSLLNYDFYMDQKRNGRAMIFSEASYVKTDKVKIILKIQRKRGNKWKKCKKYSVVKNSSVAFVNKNFKIKKKGIYRMNAEIIFYRNGREQGAYRVKTKSQKL